MVTGSTIVKTLIWCFSDYIELAERVLIHSVMEIEGGSEGGNGAIIFFCIAGGTQTINHAATSIDRKLNVEHDSNLKITETLSRFNFITFYHCRHAVTALVMDGCLLSICIIIVVYTNTI